MVALGFGAASAHASVVINGTRVVYPADEREVTIKLTNEGGFPALVQAWLDTGDPATLPQDSKVPFSLSPPLFRLDSKKGQSLRLVYTQEALATDKESLFWLNVLEVPPRESAANGDANSLQLAFRSRIKVFFRPVGLPGSAREAPAQITWKFVSSEKGAYALQATNPTAYHVTFTQVTATSGASKWTNAQGGMVDPGTSADFDVGHAGTSGSAAPPAGAALEVDYTFIDDYGAAVTGKYRPQQPR